MPTNSKIKSAEELWKRDRIEYDLVALPADESLTTLFLQTLQKRGIDWFPTMELTSLELVQTYVAEGYGIGLGAHVPQGKLRPGVRAIVLKDFPCVNFGLLWHGKMSCVTAAVAEELEKRAQEIITPGDLAIRTTAARAAAAKAIDSRAQSSL